MSNNFKQPKIKITIELEEEWIRLIQVAGKIKYGKIDIVVQNGIPVRLDNVIQQIKLDDPADFRDKMECVPLL
jgi:hypothetical protein